MKCSLNKIIILVILSGVLLPGCRKKNKPPETPYTPSGPHIALLNVTYQFGSLAFDPNGDSIAIRFDWGNEDTSEWNGWFGSGEEIWLPNSWSNYGTYYVRAQAKDKKESTSEWSLPHYVIVTQNQPPNTPSISGPSNGYILLPYTFTSSTTDPDYDSIAIRFDWGDGDTSEWCAWIASGDSVQIPHAWSNAGTYYVRAQAKDKNELFSDWSLPYPIAISSEVPEMIWVLGGGNTLAGIQFNDVWFSRDGANWACAKESAPWLPRCGHTSVIFDNKIWIIGGCYAPGTIVKLLNDVWYTADGFNWVCANESAPWSPRLGHTSIVFHNKIWVIGGRSGYDKQGEKSDVWFSSDGVNWICVTDSARFYPREFHQSVVFDNKIWVLGGECGGYPGSLLRDVWNSMNGTNWNFVSGPLHCMARKAHGSVAFQDNIWIFGGTLLCDVWCSPNGVEWTCATDSAGWGRKQYFASFVFDNKIWVIGGQGGDVQPPDYDSNDVWFSSDGINWACATPSADWSTRHSHTSVVFKIGGPNK